MEKKLSYIQQEIFLTNSSVVENVALSVPPERVDFDLVRESCSIFY